jgi:cysteinyl-tRNA synthetase
MNNQVLLYDSTTKSLVPVKDKLVTWYCCGPTIYDSAHIGHALTYVNFDVVRRVLEYFGHTVIYCMNITDVDDKIQNKLRVLGITHKELIEKYEADFKNDMTKLGVKEPTSVIRVSENIEIIQQYILKILNNGLAYISNSSIYIDSQEYIKRGLTWNYFGRCNDSVMDKNTHQDEKKNAKDFCLWKLCDENDPIGYPGTIFGIDTLGKPGWHIECSAMCHKLLGNNFTIHSGGIDLIYPHHNNECVQNTAYSYDQESNTGKSSIDIFIHTGHLHVDECKMGKSLGNSISIKSILNDINARQLRVLFLMHNYNDPLNYSLGMIETAKNFDAIIANFIALIEAGLRTDQNTKYYSLAGSHEHLEELTKLKITVDNALRNNIDTKTVLKLLFDHLGLTNKLVTAGNFNPSVINESITYVLFMLSVLGLNYQVKKDDEDNSKSAIIDLIVNTRIKLREELRNINKNKDAIKNLWTILDSIRSTMSDIGITIEDNGVSSSWRQNI